MKNKSSIIFFCLIMACWIFSSCDKECFDETNSLCENYDYCTSFIHVPTNADFTMYECIACGFGDTLMRVTDTILGGDVTFSAHEELDSYEWQVGTDTRVWTDQTFTLDFGLYVGEVIIRLIGRKRLYLDCYPDDDGIDTVYKKLWVVGDVINNSFFYEKKYEGYDLNEPDSIYTIHFTLDHNNFQGLNGFPRGCERPEDWLIGYVPGYTAFRISNYGHQYFPECGYPTGYGEIQEDRETLKIYYEVTENGERVNKTFIGKRIQ